MKINIVQKVNLLVRLFLFLVVITSCDEHKPVPPKLYERKINIIPKPALIYNYTPDKFLTLDANTVIYTTRSLEKEAIYLKKTIEKKSSFTVPIVLKTDRKELYRNPEPNALTIIMDCQHCNDKEDSVVENYVLWLRESEREKQNIIAKQVVIFSKHPSGIMRGIQTVIQLMNLEITDHLKLKRDSWKLPYVWIRDSPKFQHRGLMLDVCRHFFDKEVIKKYIDLLAFYKMNVLHLHLTEDQGWRIESEKYPKLNEISSWRTEEDGSRYGGFYTKADLKEIVAYASERHITIIPEIELPGHSQAALAAYPQFSCIGKDEKIDVANDWGVFKEIYCAGNDSTFIFLEDILTEVMEIFPSEYIHIGGDEAPKFRWENCAKCQHRMKENHLHNEHELQSYFIQRIEKFLNENDRKLIGWDEILEGGLSPNATVQSWRGMQGGIDAANSGHQAIMSPTSHCYLDYGLDQIDMEKVYAFDPIPSDLAEEKHKFIIGGEVNMWTEHVPDEQNLDSKISPRLQALAEVLWSYPKERDYDDFYKRMQSHYPILKAMRSSYGAEAVPASLKVDFNKGKVDIMASANIPNIQITKTWDDNPAEQWSNFTLTQSGRLIVQAQKNGEDYGEPITQDFAFHNALTKPVEYHSEYNNWYTARGDSALVDGKLGSLNFRDGNWQGFYGNDAEIVIDLEKEQPITSVHSAFYQYNNAWIFAPKNYTISTSLDGEHWTSYGNVKPTIDPTERGQHIALLNVEKQATARYVKVQIENLGKVPDWHEAAGADAWIFVDEIIIN